MIPITAHLHVDGHVYRVEGEVSRAAAGITSRIRYVFIDHGPACGGELEDEALEAFAFRYEQRAHDALVEAFLAAKAA